MLDVEPDKKGPIFHFLPRSASLCYFFLKTNETKKQKGSLTDKKENDFKPGRTAFIVSLLFDRNKIVNFTTANKNEWATLL